MSIQSEIERLAGAKNDIATSIENQGVTVPSDALLSDMPSLIDQIIGDVTSVNGQTGDVVLDAADVGALASDVTYVESVNGSSGTVEIAIPSNVSDLNNDSGFITGMTILSYGSSTWTDFINAYNANKVIYCRASSNSNPASGSQTRLAFMAYVSNADTPTNVEFQYYRSVATHSDSQQGDQVFVYKLDKNSGWSVITRNTFTKIAAGTNMSSSYSSGILTLAADVAVPSGASEVPQDLGVAAVGSSSDWARADHVHTMPSAEDVGAYVKPVDGIPSSDLAAGVIPLVPGASSTTPIMDGIASVGTEDSWARGDHVHSIDVTRAAADIVAVQSTQPSSSTNKLWIDSTASASAIQLATVDDIPQAVVLYYSDVAVASGSGVIATVSSTNITDVHIVAQCSFANPNYITSDVQWTTTTGQVTLSGTCSSATTASIILLKPY